jgi:hypothetical protein
MAMQAYGRVGLDFIDSAPFRFVSTVDLNITPFLYHLRAYSNKRFATA